MGFLIVSPLLCSGTKVLVEEFYARLVEQLVFIASTGTTATAVPSVLCCLFGWLVSIPNIIASVRPTKCSVVLLRLLDLCF